MIGLVEVSRYRKVIPSNNDISAVLSKVVRLNVHCRQTFVARQTTFSVMQEKCPVMLTCPLGVVIVDDELTWGHAQQTVQCYKGKYLGWKVVTKGTVSSALLFTA